MELQSAYKLVLPSDPVEGLYLDSSSAAASLVKLISFPDKAIRARLSERRHYLSVIEVREKEL